MRGDNLRDCSDACRVHGSPPHARGQSKANSVSRKSFRFTPTCAGTMLSSIFIACFVAVHPHMRGDNHKSFCGFCGNNGSPPHARGQCNYSLTGNATNRFTPTCAGTIAVGGFSGYANAVHPHMRGDNKGSDLSELPRVRFTPTCAGTIVSQCFTASASSVHPHMRGDNFSILFTPS